MEPESWKKCSTCKSPIGFSADYFKCSVSTCNKKRAPLLFCSMTCWDAHQAESRHRDAWAEPERAPTRDAHLAELARLEAPPAKAAPAAKGAPAAAPRAPRRRSRTSHEVLIVASKLKDYIRNRSGMNTSDGVFGVLSDHLRALAERASEHARADGRKTVLDRDVTPLFTKEAHAHAFGSEGREEPSDEILVVVSKFKAFVKEAAEMNTSDGVMPLLSEHLRHLSRKAIRNAGADGRKTVLDRDFVAAGAGDL